MTDRPSLDVLEALSAVEGDEYGEALARVLAAVPAPSATAWALARPTPVEGIVWSLRLRLEAGYSGELLPRERVALRHHAWTYPALAA